MKYCTKSKLLCFSLIAFGAIDLIAYTQSKIQAQVQIQSKIQPEVQNEIQLQVQSKKTHAQNTAQGKKAQVQIQSKIQSKIQGKIQGKVQMRTNNMQPPSQAASLAKNTQLASPQLPTNYNSVSTASQSLSLK